MIGNDISIDNSKKIEQYAKNTIVHNNENKNINKKIKYYEKIINTLLLEILLFPTILILYI